ncbi:MAG TPA: tRNA pseudouridine(13) synthase TruD [Tepidisphaeraceae bacterium]|nr:tRNA pseudouridine(13) synthase TruD [Tepidisphaeraceae bacterium]
MSTLPYLTREFPGIGGVIKQRPEDFFVQEIPLYEPTGAGEHVYVEIQKVGVTTFDAVRRIADALRVPPREIGYAGMKDARAVTRQVLSIRGAGDDAVAALRLPDIQVLWAMRHENKLRLGHLSGNRFAIKIRDVDATAVVKLRPVLDVLEKRGMPNYFGEQRFGRRGDNDRLGAALIRDDNEGVLKLLLGHPDPSIDDPQTVQARDAFDRRDNAASMKAWPRRSGMERRVLARLMKTHRPGAAVRAVDEKIRRLWVSALQSRVFNDVVARRIEQLDQLLDGDLAYKHENGACFLVETSAAEQARAHAFEISPTGPLVGYRMSLPQGRQLELEQAVLAEVGLEPGDFRKAGKHKVKGARRPLRVRPTDVELSGGVDEHGSHVTVAFTLPSGSYATVLLREIMKDDAGSLPRPTDAGADDAEMDDSADPENENSGPVDTGPEVDQE